MTTGQAGKQVAGPVLPGATIGVLGGGQLGRMLALAGRAMGYRFATLDPTPDSPCGQVAEVQITAPYDDREAALRLAEQCDVITYEFESVDADVAALLERTGRVPQGSRLLHVTQHRLREKRALEAAGVPVAPYREVNRLEDLQTAVDELGLPGVLKTVTGGYDGKGQRVIRREAELADAHAALGGSGTGLIYEQFISFERELSVIAARSPGGETVSFPPANNVHVDNILHLSIVPGGISREIAEQARRLAETVAAALDVVGLLGVELFQTADGKLYVNELAPRPHNSGHYTMDACNVSQFEQHVRAICCLPLVEPKLLTSVVMVNVLGEHVAPLLDFLAGGGEREWLAHGITPKVHLYGKHEAKPQRKMGHVNLLTDDPEAAIRLMETSGIWR